MTFSLRGPCTQTHLRIFQDGVKVGIGGSGAGGLCFLKLFQKMKKMDPRGRKNSCKVPTLQFPVFLEKLESLSQDVTLSTVEGTVKFWFSPVSWALLPSAAYFLSASVDFMQSAQRAGLGGVRGRPPIPRC